MSLSSKTNLGWHFYRNYFLQNNGLLDLTNNNLKKDSTEDLFKAKNKDITDTKYELPGLQQNTSKFFILKTTYPGLLLGAGYGHEISAKGEFKLGFFFDYTSGLPIIPGSSIKGVLRSVFPNYKKRSTTDNIQYKDEELDKTKAAWIQAQLNEINNPKFLSEHFNPIDHITDEQEQSIFKLCYEIFEGVKDHKHEKNEDKYLSIYKRDIFLDSIIYKAGNDQLIVGSDSITPHKKDGLSYEESMLKNPVPLPFLKVLPNVEFQFRFDLKDGDILTAEQKEKLFKKIILTIGIGAKTNVGYGQFVEDIKNNDNTQNGTNSISEEDTHSENKSNPNKSVKPVHTTNSAPTILDSIIPPSEETLKNIKANTESEGKIISKKGNNFLIEMRQFDESCYILKKKEDKFSEGVPEIGKKVKIVFLENKSVNSFHAFVLED